MEKIRVNMEGNTSTRNKKSSQAQLLIMITPYYSNSYYYQYHHNHLPPPLPSQSRRRKSCCRTDESRLNYSQNFSHPQHLQLQQHMSSQDRLLLVHFQQAAGQRLFMQHSFITFRERGKTGQDERKAKVPLSVPPQLSISTPTPPTLIEQEVGGGKYREEEPQKLSNGSGSTCGNGSCSNVSYSTGSNGTQLKIKAA